MHLADATTAIISFSELSVTAHKPLVHKVVGDAFEYDENSKRCVLRVERLLQVPLGHYQGVSTIDIQIETGDGKTIVGNGGTVSGSHSSNAVTALLDLRFVSIGVLSPPDTK